jgi:PPM family protein phosphatase
MSIAAGNAQHIGSRPQQQDSFGFSDPADEAFVGHAGILGLVADGMGGLTNGQEASSAAALSFLKAYEAKTPQESVVDALSRSLREANCAVLRVAAGSPSSDAGTTLAAAVIVDQELYWISTGDSRIYWIHDKEATQLTADHIYAKKLDREVALGKMSRIEALNHSERSSLTSYLGQEELALVDRNLRPLSIKTTDYILVCSDGLYRGLTGDEIVTTVQTHPQRACEALVQLVIGKHRNQQDNLTVIALKSAPNGRWPGRLSRRAWILLILAVAVVVLSGFFGYSYGRLHFLWGPSAPAGTTQQPSPPVTVSKPATSTPTLPPPTPGSAQPPPANGGTAAGNAGATGGAPGAKPSGASQTHDRRPDHSHGDTPAKPVSSNPQSGGEDRSGQPAHPAELPKNQPVSGQPSTSDQAAPPRPSDPATPPANAPTPNSEPQPGGKDQSDQPAHPAEQPKDQPGPGQPSSPDQAAPPPPSDPTTPPANPPSNAPTPNSEPHPQAMDSSPHGPNSLQSPPASTKLRHPWFFKWYEAEVKSSHVVYDSSHQ